jgi:hypothetical protein
MRHSGRDILYVKTASKLTKLSEKLNQLIKR